MKRPTIRPRPLARDSALDTLTRTALVESGKHRFLLRVRYSPFTLSTHVAIILLPGTSPSHITARVQTQGNWTDGG